MIDKPATTGRKSSCSRDTHSGNLMNVAPLSVDLISQTMALMDLGKPYVKARTASDYWLYATLFSSTCPTALIDDELAGAVIAFRSQDQPEDVYIQDVMTHPDHRRRGVAQTLINFVRDQAIQWRCTRIYLTSEPDNTTAQATWERLGFTNAGGDHLINGVPSSPTSRGLASTAPSTNCRCDRVAQPAAQQRCRGLGASRHAATYAGNQRRPGRDVRCSCRVVPSDGVQGQRCSRRSGGGRAGA